ncbi:SRPBCC family protein [Paenibacillus apiarius]
MDHNSKNTLPDIRQTLVLNAPIQKVWDAVATSEGIAAWFMPNNFQPIEGYEFELNAGPFGMSPCKVTEIDPPNRLSFNWGKDWTLTFELVDLDGKTEFTLIHAGWDADKVTEFGQSHATVRDRMNQGWTGLQQSLAAYVEGSNDGSITEA